MTKSICSLMAVFCIFALTNCGGGSGQQVPRTANDDIVVNSLADLADPPAGTVTLRSALASAATGKPITFASSLNGATIQLSIVGESHSVLKGETYSGMTFAGYAERDYGKSALYAKKDVVIDASSLPAGITLNWTGGDANPARVLGVYGNLTLTNVTVKGGISKAESLSDTAQPFTLARGAGIAVWGRATLTNSTIAGNKVIGDTEATRDRGAYGGGVYANALVVKGSIISGNSAIGYGAAGGGAYSVGGGDVTTGYGLDSSFEDCTISGNRTTAQHSYGGGLFTLGGGPNNWATATVKNCTVARNLVEDNPDLANTGQFYDRGGGIYLGGGSLQVTSSTIVENAVTGTLAIFSGSPNTGGGGIAATIGNAHVVENMKLEQSIVAGNTLNGGANDVFTGSLIDFFSYGYNRFGVLDFSRILVPVPDWKNSSRRHYPKVGDRDGVALNEVVLAANPTTSNTITSVGVAAGTPAVLWYTPTNTALDQVPTGKYDVAAIMVGYTGFGVSSDDFINQVLAKLRTQYATQLGSNFGTEFGDMTGVTFYGPSQTWPSNAQNTAWITFWRDLDTKIAGRLGTAGLNDDFWSTFQSGALGNEMVTVQSSVQSRNTMSTDQCGKSRPTGMNDIGAIEH